MDAGGAGEVFVNLYSPYQEFHDTERSTLVYAVNRPFVDLDEVAEGGGSITYAALEETCTYVFDRIAGQVQRVGFAGATAAGIAIGPDYPDDEFIRFPMGRKRQGPAFVSGARAVRLTYTGGYLGDAARRHVPPDLRRLCKKMVARAFRSDAFQDTELSSQSDNAGTRSKLSHEEWTAEVEMTIARHRSSSFTARAQFP